MFGEASGRLGPRPLGRKRVPRMDLKIQKPLEGLRKRASFSPGTLLRESGNVEDGPRGKRKISAVSERTKALNTGRVPKGALFAEKIATGTGRKLNK